MKKFIFVLLILLMGIPFVSLCYADSSITVHIDVNSTTETDIEFNGYEPLPFETEIHMVNSYTFDITYTEAGVYDYYIKQVPKDSNITYDDTVWHVYVYIFDKGDHFEDFVVYTINGIDTMEPELIFNNQIKNSEDTAQPTNAGAMLTVPESTKPEEEEEEEAVPYEAPTYDENLIIEVVDENDNNISGIEFQINKHYDTLLSWVSDTEPYYCALPYGTYVLHENTSTFNHTPIDDITLQVIEGSISVGDTILTDNTLVIRCDDIDINNTDNSNNQFKIQINQLNNENVAIEGAKLQILQSKSILHSWVSNELSYDILLSTGTYTLKQEAAPLGYEPISDVVFMINENGKITLQDKTIKYIQISDNVINIINEPTKISTPTEDSNTVQSTDINTKTEEVNNEEDSPKDVPIILIIIGGIILLGIIVGTVIYLISRRKK